MCLLWEVVIFSVVLSRCSVLALYFVVVLMKLFMFEYVGMIFFFMCVLFDKKYVLLFSVVDVLVDYFLCFLIEEREFSVVWY